MPFVWDQRLLVLEQAARRLKFVLRWGLPLKTAGQVGGPAAGPYAMVLVRPRDPALLQNRELVFGDTKLACIDNAMARARALGLDLE